MLRRGILVLEVLGFLPGAREQITQPSRQRRLGATRDLRQRIQPAPDLGRERPGVDPGALEDRLADAALLLEQRVYEVFGQELGIASRGGVVLCHLQRFPRLIGEPVQPHRKNLPPSRNVTTSFSQSTAPVEAPHRRRRRSCRLPHGIPIAYKTGAAHERPAPHRFHRAPDDRLIAQLATAGGARTPLARIANQVFVELAEELEGQGLSRKVTADMFGISLRSYQRKVQRLRESRTEQGHRSGRRCSTT